MICLWIAKDKEIVCFQKKVKWKCEDSASEKCLSNQFGDMFHSRLSFSSWAISKYQAELILTIQGFSYLIYGKQQHFLKQNALVGAKFKGSNFNMKQTPLIAFLILCSCQNFPTKIAYSISCSNHGSHQFLMITSIEFNFIFNWMNIFSWHLYYTIFSHEVEQQILKFSIQQEHHFCIHYFIVTSYLFWNIFCIYSILHINYLWNWESMENFKCRIS